MVPTFRASVGLAQALLASACVGIPVAVADAPASVDPATAALIERLGLVEAETPVRERQGWRKPQRILVWNLAPQLAASLQAAAPGVELLLVDDAAQAAALARDADAVLGLCSPEVGRQPVRTSAGSSPYSAGVERCVTIPARPRSVTPCL